MARLVALCSLLALCLPFFPAEAQAANSQVWVLVHVIGRDKDEGVVDVQMPLEALRDMKGTITCDENDQNDTTGRGGYVGREIYEKYRDLPLGEEREVESRKCHDADVTVRAVCRELEPSKPASRLRILVRGKGDDASDNVDIGLSMDTLKDLGGLLNTIGMGSHARDLKDIDGFPGGLDLLKRLPPFEMVKIVDDHETVIIKTE
jgi:hypothetical protein